MRNLSKAFKPLNTYIMKAEMFISSLKGISPEDVMGVLVGHGVLANVTPIYSSVYNKKADVYQAEKGVKIDIFDITPKKLIHLWIDGLKSRRDLDLHCAYINTHDYNGCILSSKWYIKFCKRCCLIPEICSEY